MFELMIEIFHGLIIITHDDSRTNMKNGHSRFVEKFRFETFFVKMFDPVLCVTVFVICGKLC